MNQNFYPTDTHFPISSPRKIKQKLKIDPTIIDTTPDESYKNYSTIHSELEDKHAQLAQLVQNNQFKLKNYHVKFQEKLCKKFAQKPNLVDNLHTFGVGSPFKVFPNKKYGCGEDDEILKEENKSKIKRKLKKSFSNLNSLKLNVGGELGEGGLLTRAEKLKTIEEVYGSQSSLFWKKNFLENDTCTGKRREIGSKSVCLEGCRYDVVRRISLELGFSEVAENEVWNILWTDAPISLDKALDMRRLQDSHSVYLGARAPIQKTNHFPGMHEICRKDRLARNLNRMKKLFPSDYDFFPQTWNLPSDMPDLLAHFKSHRSPTYICKPDSGCQGKGIFLIRNIKKLNPYSKLICQHYIPNPLLIDGYKFDLRIYILITSCDPLRVYIYNEGIARFATIKYVSPSDQNVDVVFMHLTNYSLNKFSQSYLPEPEGSKRKLSTVYGYLVERGYDVDELMEDIDKMIVKTVAAAQPTLKHYYRASFPKQDRGSACFEILGFDILIDENLKPWLLEVNLSPSFNLDLAVDAEIKEALLRDTFNKIYLGSNSAKEAKGKLFSTQRRKGVVNLPQSTTEISDKAGNNLAKALQMQFYHEQINQGNFRLVYPNDNCFKFAHLFDPNVNVASVTNPQTTASFRRHVANEEENNPNSKPGLLDVETYKANKAKKEQIKSSGTSSTSYQENIQAKLRAILKTPDSLKNSNNCSRNSSQSGSGKLSENKKIVVKPKKKSIFKSKSKSRSKSKRYNAVLEDISNNNWSEFESGDILHEKGSQTNFNIVDSNLETHPNNSKSQKNNETDIRGDFDGECPERYNKALSLLEKSNEIVTDIQRALSNTKKSDGRKETKNKLIEEWILQGAQESESFSNNSTHDTHYQISEDNDVNESKWTPSSYLVSQNETIEKSSEKIVKVPINSSFKKIGVKGKQISKSSLGNYENYSSKNTDDNNLNWSKSELLVRDLENFSRTDSV